MSKIRLKPEAKARKISRLVDRDGTQCFWCNEELLFEARFHDPDNPRCATFDHLIPISRGGGNEDANLVLACRECNGARGNTSFVPPAYRRALEDAA